MATDTKESLAEIGAGDCPKHGRWYGICHSCAHEAKKKDEWDDKQRLYRRIEQLEAERALFVKLEEAVNRSNNMADVIQALREHRAAREAAKRGEGT